MNNHIKFRINDWKKRKTIKNQLIIDFNKIASFILIDRLKIIKKVNVIILKEFPSAKGYDLAFDNLYNNGVINFIITPSYDINREGRMNALAHELVHIKDMIDEKLKFDLNNKVYFWNGKKHNKVYSYSKFDSIETREEQINYISKICPWEKEACEIADNIVNLV